MRAVLRVAAHQIKARWRAWAMFVLLTAIAGGAVLTTAAGARRTASAYSRFLTASHAADVLVTPESSGVGGYYRALARLPGVAAVAPVVGLNVLPLLPGHRLDSASAAAAGTDGRYGHLLEIPKVLAGRLPLPGRREEIAVDQIGAAILHLHVGSTLAMGVASNGPPQPGGSARLHVLSERVVGIIVTRGSVDPVTDIDKIPAIIASTALWHALPGYVAYDAAYVKLRPGAAVGGFIRRAGSLARRFPGTGGQVLVADLGTQAAVIERSIRPGAIALALFALVLGITALLVVGQTATRLLVFHAADNPTLAALGMTRGQLMAAGLLTVGVAAAAGAVAATAVAVAASPLMPIGAARLAEPDPGFSVDATVLAVGAAGIVALLVARAAWPAWRLASASGARRREVAESRGRGSPFAAWLAAAGLPVTAAVGVRLALEPGRGHTAVPVRSALAGTVLSVLAVTAAFTFGANLLHLVHTPRLYGQRWDAAIDLQFSVIPPRQAERLVSRDPAISGWTLGDHGFVGIDGAVIPAIGVARGRGPLLSPTLLAGRPPGTEHEIVLGAATLRQIGRQVGQSVTVTVGGHQMSDRIVGSAVFPNFGQGGLTPTDLGQGAETTAAVLQPQAQAVGGGPGFQFALVRFKPGHSPAADLAGFQRSMASFCQLIQQSTCVVAGQRPNSVASYASIDGTPEVLAVVLAVLGTAVLGQLVVVSGRRRRRDFAILKALGMLRWQVSSITTWQLTTLAVLALLIGLPLGIAVGRWSWELFAGGLGIPADAITPVPVVLLMVPAVVLVANAVAVWPARSGARLSPARVLRAE